MKLSKKFKRKSIFIVVWGVVILVGVGFLGQKYQIQPLNEVVQTITYPFQKGISVATSKWNDLTSYFKNHTTLVTENEWFKQENDRLHYENTVLEQYREENNQLKELLEMEQRYKDYPTTGANIIGKDTGNWYKVFTIDKGTVQGLAVNDVILSGGGLVGHIIETSAFSSKALTIIDDRSYVSATVLRTGDVGILRGDIELFNSGICKMEIDIESEVVKGDLIITSHLSSIYPPGVPIGIVEEVTTSENGLIQYAYIKPYVDFKHLESVLVISQNS